jgi:hypothetical protein
MKKALIVGDSMTSGFRMPPAPGNDNLAIENPSCSEIWYNRLLAGLDDFEIHNMAITGASNDTIFYTAAEQIVAQRFDLVLVQWTYWSRLNLQIGLETYNTRSMLHNSADIHLVNHQTIAGSWLDNLGQRISWVSNPHWSLLQLVRHVNILKQLQSVWSNSKIFFVNGLVYIPKDFFTHMQYQTPNELPSFVRDMLSADLRDDEEIRQLYKIIQNYICFKLVQNYTPFTDLFKIIQKTIVTYTKLRNVFVSKPYETIWGTNTCQLFCSFMLYESLRASQAQSACSHNLHPRYR